MPFLMPLAQIAQRGGDAFQGIPGSGLGGHEMSRQLTRGSLCSQRRAAVCNLQAVNRRTAVIDKSILQAICEQTPAELDDCFNTTINISEFNRSSAVEAGFHYRLSYSAAYPALVLFRHLQPDLVCRLRHDFVAATGEVHMFGSCFTVQVFPNPGRFSGREIC